MKRRELIQSTKQYLQQQIDLFGNTAYLDTPIVREASQVFGDSMPHTSYASLDELYTSIQNCQDCPLGQTRTKFVFGVGNPNARLVLVGEAPGKQEDIQGEPFVGRAGQLLDKILDAIHLNRQEVYICNILKCRPPNNRDPLPDEVDQCEPYLQEQLQLISPKIILALGRVAAQNLLKTKTPLNKLRNAVHDYHGIDVVVTYHPAALLRNPGLKRPAWEDIQKVRQMYDAY